MFAQRPISIETLDELATSCLFASQLLSLYLNKNKIYLNQTHLLSPNLFLDHFPPIFLAHNHSMLLRIIPPSEPKFIAQPGLPNEEYGPFSEDEDEVLHNQP